MASALSTGTYPNKCKFFTSALLLLSGMDTNNSLLFDVNFVRFKPSSLHVLITLLIRIFAAAKSSTDLNRSSTCKLFCATSTASLPNSVTLSTDVLLNA